MSKTNYDIAIIGGGIVGTATAFKIQNKYPNLILNDRDKVEIVQFIGGG